MIFNKEKVKLLKLASAIGDIQVFSEAGLLGVNDIFIEYTKIIRTLHKANPNVFANLYKYDLAEIRNHKKLIHEDFNSESNQASFMRYKNAVTLAIESATAYITDYTEN